MTYIVITKYLYSPSTIDTCSGVSLEELREKLKVDRELNVDNIVEQTICEPIETN